MTTHQNFRQHILAQRQKKNQDQQAFHMWRKDNGELLRIKIGSGDPRTVEKCLEAYWESATPATKRKYNKRAAQAIYGKGVPTSAPHIKSTKQPKPPRPLKPERRVSVPVACRYSSSVIRDALTLGPAVVSSWISADARVRLDRLRHHIGEGDFRKYVTQFCNEVNTPRFDQLGVVIRSRRGGAVGGGAEGSIVRQEARSCGEQAAGGASETGAWDGTDERMAMLLALKLDEWARDIRLADALRERPPPAPAPRGISTSVDLPWQVLQQLDLEPNLSPRDYRSEKFNSILDDIRDAATKFNEIRQAVIRASPLYRELKSPIM